MHANNGMLSQAQTAEFYGVSLSTVRRWIAQGKLRAYKIGSRAIRIDPADLHSIAEEINPATFEHVSGGGSR